MSEIVNVNDKTNLNQNENEKLSISQNDNSEQNSNTYVATPLKMQAAESGERKIIRENFEYFGLFSIIYAVFFTFCLYKNDAGITMPLLEAGTIYYYIKIIKKLKLQIKKDAAFYIIGILLLGTSICLTDDIRLNIMSKLGIAILFMSFMLHHFYNDTKWSFGKYLEALGMLAIMTIAAVEYPFTDPVLALKAKQKKENEKLKYVFIGIIVAAPLTLVIMSLLLSADKIFSNIFVNMMEGRLFVLKNVFTILFMIIFAYIAIYCFINALAKREIKEENTDKRVLEPIIAITFSAIISIIYIMFCTIQIAGLFFRQIQIPQGYTYAQYAREGFFQLLFVCGINLVMVLCCMAFFRKSKILKGLLSIISVCTYIMIASSAYRMMIYIRVYQLTFLRIFVLWALLVITIIMSGILLSIYQEKFPLFKFSMAVVTICYIGLAYSPPDYFIASYNMKAMAVKAQKESISTEYEDYGDLYYITSLSADAAPALMKYQGEDEIVKAYFQNVKEQSKVFSFRTFNVSRYLAGKAANQFFGQ
jgi:hypothetical protein